MAKSFAGSVFCGLSALLLTACDSAERTAQIVSSVRQCGGIQLPNGLLMRVSSYHGYPDSAVILQVSACASDGTACYPVVSTMKSLPPLFSLTDEGNVRIEVYGGYLVQKSTASTRVNGRSVKFHILETGRSPDRQALKDHQARAGRTEEEMKLDGCDWFRSKHPDPTR